MRKYFVNLVTHVAMLEIARSGPTNFQEVLWSSILFHMMRFCLHLWPSVSSNEAIVQSHRRFVVHMIIFSMPHTSAHIIIWVRLSSIVFALSPYSIDTNRMWIIKQSKEQILIKVRYTLPACASDKVSTATRAPRAYRVAKNIMTIVRVTQT